MFDSGGSRQGTTRTGFGTTSASLGSSFTSTVSSLSNAAIRKPLRISRLIVLKSLGPQLIPFTQSASIYFVLFLPHDAVCAVACFIKCLPILSLCCFVAIHGNVLDSTSGGNVERGSSIYSRWILAGLIFSGLGDGFLQFSAVGYFLPGMAAFGLAHVCYAVGFGLQPLHPLSGAVIFTLAGGVFACLFPYLHGVFPYAVGIYFVLVSTMGWRAIARVPLLNDLWTWTKLGAAIGSLLFCMSDLMIAIKIFYGDFPFSQVLIMTTYYVAQMGIAVSVVEGQLRPVSASTPRRSLSPVEVTRTEK